MLKAVIVLKNPFDTTGQLVRKERGTTQTEGQIHIHKITGLPVKTQKVPIIGWTSIKQKADLRSVLAMKASLPRDWITLMVSSTRTKDKEN